MATGYNDEVISWTSATHPASSGITLIYTSCSPSPHPADSPPPCSLLMQLSILLWVVARCRVSLPEDSRDVLADAIFTRLEDMPKRTIFSVTTALIILGNRSVFGRLGG